VVERFYGSFEYVLDAKGRVILPARLRSAFEGKRAIVSAYVERCLAVWTPVGFDRFLAKAEAMEARGADGRALARALHAYSNDVELDAQGRLSIPAALRDWAGLRVDSPVAIYGAGNRVELWRPEDWRERMTASLESLADGTSPLFGPEELAASVAEGAA
jgi:MraZ protein